MRVQVKMTKDRTLNETSKSTENLVNYPKGEIYWMNKEQADEFESSGYGKIVKKKTKASSE